MSWETLGAGISYPVDGCPTGSMEFTMSPFTVTVVFDGSDTATYTMRNGSTVIPEGSGTTYLGCGTPVTLRSGRATRSITADSSPCSCARPD